MKKAVMFSIVVCVVLAGSVFAQEQADKPVLAASEVPHQILLKPETLNDLVDMQRYLVMKERHAVQEEIETLSSSVTSSTPELMAARARLIRLERELANIDLAAKGVMESKKAPIEEVVSKDIVVLGDVKRPGIYKFADKEPCTLMHLIFKMGGLPQNVDGDDIKIRRVTGAGSDKVMQVNIEKALATGDPKDDVPLQDGDRVIITR